MRIGALHWPRIKSAITNHDCHVPVTIGLTQIIRPVCLASEANNSMLFQVLAWIVNAITKIADKDKVLCSSLEAVNSDPDSRTPSN